MLAKRRKPKRPRRSRLVIRDQEVPQKLPQRVISKGTDKVQ